MAKKPTSWYCSNKPCGNVLGYVASNELVVEISGAVANINTNGVSIVVTCAKCGTAKVWYPNLESSVTGALNAFKRDLIVSMRG